MLISISVTFQNLLLFVPFRKIASLKGEIESSLFFPSFCQHLDATLARLNNKDRNIPSIVCLGLGKISSCKTAQYQLGLLLLVIDKYRCSRTKVYDPVFTNCDKSVLIELGLQVIEDNCEGHHPNNSQQTLYFFPHCPRELSNNLLHANWSQQCLPKCLIIANSFESLVLHTPERVLLQDYYYLFKVQQVVEELPLINNFHHLDVFNDLSVHTFPEDRCINLDQTDFWTHRPKPVAQKETAS